MIYQVFFFHTDINHNETYDTVVLPLQSATSLTGSFWRDAVKLLLVSLDLE